MSCVYQTALRLTVGSKNLKNKLSELKKAKSK